MVHQHQPSITFEPQVSDKLYRGISQLVAAIRPTMGPTPHLTAVERGDPRLAPELLDDGGLIARRVTELSDRDENIGAMLLRNLLWQLHEEAGDGTATAAILFESLYQQGRRAIAAGASSSRLVRHLQDACQVVTDALHCLSLPCATPDQLSAIAASVGADTDLADLLGETFSVIGRYGRLELKSSYGRGIRRDYLEGHHWRSHIASTSMLTDQSGQQVRLERPLILTSDLALDDPHEVVPLVVQAAVSDQSLLLIARSFSKAVSAVFLANQDMQRRPIVAVKTPGSSDDERRSAIEDIVHLVGGRAFLQAAGDRLSRLGQEDLGTAQRARVFAESFAITGGKGNPRQLRDHINVLTHEHERAQNIEERGRLQERIGTLQGSAATIWIGGSTESEAKHRKRRAEQATTVLRAVMATGIVPGGGAALYSCRAHLECAMANARDNEARLAHQMVHCALETPLRTIIENAGAESAPIVAEVERCGAGYGFDARIGEVVDTIAAGIVDATNVQHAAIRGAIHAVAIALTIGVTVHGGTPEVATNP